MKISLNRVPSEARDALVSRIDAEIKEVQKDLAACRYLVPILLTLRKNGCVWSDRPFIVAGALDPIGYLEAVYAIAERFPELVYEEHQ